MHRSPRCGETRVARAVASETSASCPPRALAIRRKRPRCPRSAPSTPYAACFFVWTSRNVPTRLKQHIPAVENAREGSHASKPAPGRTHTGLPGARERLPHSELPATLFHKCFDPVMLSPFRLLPYRFALLRCAASASVAQRGDTSEPRPCATRPWLMRCALCRIVTTTQSVSVLQLTPPQWITTTTGSRTTASAAGRTGNAGGKPHRGNAVGGRRHQCENPIDEATGKMIVRA